MNRTLPFQYLLNCIVVEGAIPFPGLLLYTLDPYLKMLTVKQDGIEYHFLVSLV